MCHSGGHAALHASLLHCFILCSVYCTASKLASGIATQNMHPIVLECLELWRAAASSYTGQALLKVCSKSAKRWRRRQ